MIPLYYVPMTEKERLSLEILAMTPRAQLEEEVARLRIARELSGGEMTTEESFGRLRDDLISSLVTQIHYQDQCIKELKVGLENIYLQLDRLGVAMGR